MTEPTTEQPESVLGDDAEWQARLAAQTEAWRQRQADKAAVRRALAEARRHGLAARHAAKLRRGRRNR